MLGQQKIVAIHPYNNGNGRLSRLMMTKVLQGYSLNEKTDRQAFPKIEDPDQDLVTKSDDWCKLIFPPEPKAEEQPALQTTTVAETEHEKEEAGMAPK